jgi:hypothetical protein
MRTSIAHLQFVGNTVGHWEILLFSRNLCLEVSPPNPATTQLCFATLLKRENSGAAASDGGAGLIKVTGEQRLTTNHLSLPAK